MVEHYNLVYSSNITQFSELNYIKVIFTQIFFVTIIFVLYRWRKKLHGIQKTLSSMLIVILLLFIYGTLSAIPEVENIKDAIKNKTYYILEGNITNFHAMSNKNHNSEMFTINNVKFYVHFPSDQVNESTSYYGLTKNKGGPIVKNGQKIKVHYIKYPLSRLCIPVVNKCIIFNQEHNNQEYDNRIIKMWIHDPTQVTTATQR